MKRILIIAATIVGNAAHAEPVTLFQPSQCVNGKCGPIQTAATNVVNYAGNVGQAIVQPARGVLSRVREVIQNRPRLFNRCR